MVALYIVLGTIGGLVLIFFIALAFIHHFVFYSPHKNQNNSHALTKATEAYGMSEEIHAMIDKMMAAPYEDAWICSYDLLRLHGRVYRSKTGSKQVAIMCHGYRGTPCRDFSGGGLALIDMGLNVIIIDQRGHGLSKGHNITFGVREKEDVKSWCTYAHQLFGDDIEIILVGISMGGAAVLMASDMVDATKIIADCPYTTEKEILVETIKSMKLSVKIFYPLINLSSIIFSRTNMNRDDANDHVKRSKAKILIIHGNDDHIVPHRLSERIYLNNKDKVQYEIFEKTDHGISYLKDKNRYIKLVKDFINN